MVGTVWSAKLEIVGGSLTGETVRVKLVDVMPNPSSMTITEIWAVPDRLATGVMLRVRLEPLPLSTTLGSGTRVGSKERTRTVKALDGVSASPTVNGIGPVV